MDQLLTTLRAVAEPTRLRLLALLARSELTVSDLVFVLGQSQPSISRHLKLLLDAGLLERQQEGSRVFHRLGVEGPPAELAAMLLEHLPDNDAQLGRDLSRLAEIRAHREAVAQTYFESNARDWDRIRSLHVDEATVERAMLEACRELEIDVLLDLGCGTGRVMELFARRARQVVGVDLNREMLNVARARLERERLSHCRVRHGDIRNLPTGMSFASLVTIHHVLHFLDQPEVAIAEAAHALTPGGRLLVVDFARHEHEFLRDEFQHRRLGFGAGELERWCVASGLVGPSITRLDADGGDRGLTVLMVVADKPRIAPVLTKEVA